MRAAALAAWAALTAGAALAVTPVQVVHSVDFAPGSAALDEQAASAIAFAIQSAAQVRSEWFQLAGFAPGDAVLATGRAAAVRDALLRAGVAPARIVVLAPGAVPDRYPSEPDRVEIALCGPAPADRCLSR